MHYIPVPNKVVGQLASNILSTCQSQFLLSFSAWRVLSWTVYKYCNKQKLCGIIDFFQTDYFQIIPSYKKTNPYLFVIKSVVFLMM